MFLFADVVGADRSSRWPRSTGTASHRAGTADVVSWRRAPRDRAAAEEHTSSTSTTTASSIRRAGSRWRSARAGRGAQVVAVHRDVERADGDPRPSMSRMRAATRRARKAPRVGMPSRTTSSAPLGASDDPWATRVRARAISALSSTVRASSGVRGTSLRPFPASQDGLKGCRSLTLPDPAAPPVPACGPVPGTVAARGRPRGPGAGAHPEWSIPPCPM